MQKRKHLLQRKVFFYMIIFTLLIFFLLWFFQIFFIRSFYETAKKNTVINHINEFKKNYSVDNNLYEELENYANNDNICSEIIINNQVEYSTDSVNKACYNYFNNVSSVKEKETEFLNSSNSEEIFIIDSQLNNSKILLYGVKLNSNTTIFAVTRIVPIDSTVEILRNQLIMITILTIILSLITAYIISNLLTKPIISLTEKSKELANGNFNVNFDINTDIVEVNELTKTLNSTRDALIKNDEIRRDLMANVSHDLKTPLTMVKAYAEMVRDISYNNEEKRTHNLNVIVEEVDRLNLLVNDILALSKLESNIEKTNREEFDLIALISTIISHFKIFSITQSYEFVFLSPKKLVVFADKQKMEQVIYNLISNAINYSKESKKIYIVILPRDNIRVNIADTGPGIKKQDIDKIWDKYYQAEKKYRRNTVGTGLGLSIVKNIFELHGYKYGVYSKKNKGTTFYFEIKKKISK